MSRRIGAAIVAVTVLAIVLFGTPLAIAVDNLYRDQEVIRLEREATEAALGLGVTSLGHGQSTPLPTLGGHRSLGLYVSTGERVAGDGPLLADDAVRRARDGDITQSIEDNKSISVAIPISDRGHVTAIMRASIPEHAVQGRARATWAAMAAIGLAAIGVAAVVGVVVARRLAAPIRALADVAERLGHGDFSMLADRVNIAEVDRVAETLNITARRIDEALTRERAFSADASHQLRTPLTALRVRIESALVDEHANARLVLASSLTEVDRLESTIDDLLALSRDTHKSSGPLDVVGLLNGTESTWHAVLAADGRLLRTKADEGLVVVVASDVAVRQALEVLLDNARTHGLGTVTVYARNSGGGLVIDVSDEGTDRIEKEGTIFRRRQGSGSGHGIGLALARSLIEAEGGRLVLRHCGPQPVFSIVFPAIDPSAARIDSRRHAAS